MQPKCESCGVPFTEHLGLQGTCAELVALHAEIKGLREKLRTRQAATNADIFRYRRSGQIAAEYRAEGDSIGVAACIELLTALIEKQEVENG